MPAPAATPLSGLALSADARVRLRSRVCGRAAAPGCVAGGRERRGAGPAHLTCLAFESARGTEFIQMLRLCLGSMYKCTMLKKFTDASNEAPEVGPELRVKISGF